MNIENTELENTTPEIEGKDSFDDKSRPGPGKPSEPPLLAGEEKPKKRGGSLLGFFTFVLAALALSLAGWTWWQMQMAGNAATSAAVSEVARLDAGQSQLSLEIKQLRDEIDTLASGDVSAEFEALQRRLETDRRQMADVERALQEQLALSRSLQAAAESAQGRLRAAEAAVSSLSTRELDAGGELDLAEVDYLLRLANERLKLFSDPGAADEALEVADMHLAALDNPLYLGVRQEIAAARRALAGVEMPVYLEIAGELDAVQAAIPDLAFITPEMSEPLESSTTEDDGWWSSFKNAFSSLVTVRRSSGEETERLSIEDKDFIRQRVWLQFEIAHLALMRQDQDSFRAALDRAEESIAAWFDPASGSFGEVSAGISALRALEIEVDMPDITAPWSTLRLLRNASPAVPLELPAEDMAEDEPESEGDAG